MRATGHGELVVDGEHLERVVVQGMLAARSSLAVMTADFKAMLVPGPRGGRARSVVERLAELAERGVEVRILHAGVPSGPALRQLKGGLPRGMVIRRCPRLHSKAVVVDAARMYIGSANLTGAGLGAKGASRRNFEMGLWSESPGLVDAVLEQFNALWEGSHCAGCGRREVCPVPLEEPRL